MKRIMIGVLLCLAVSAAFAAIAFCETSAKAAQAAEKEMTKEEAVSELKDLLETEDELFNTIPGLEANKDAGGRFFYTYKGVKLEDVGKDELNKLLVHVRQTVTRIRTERIQNQLETIRQAERLKAVSSPRVPSVPVAPREAPRVPSSTPSAAKALPLPPPNKK